MTSIEYVVTWREWLGSEPYGKIEYQSRRKSFITRPEAKAYFVRMKKRHNGVEFRKVTNELLGESE